jgi:hypothetical protein
MVSCIMARIFLSLSPLITRSGAIELFLRRPRTAQPRTFISPTAYDTLSIGASPYVFVQRQSGVDGGAALLAAADQTLAGDKKKLFGLFGAGTKPIRTVDVRVDGSRSRVCAADWG